MKNKMRHTTGCAAPAEPQKKKHRPAIHPKLATVLYIILFGTALALLVMTVLDSAGVEGIWSGTPVVLVLTIMGIAVAAAFLAYNPCKPVYSLGFYILHIGIVVFLIGTLVYHISGDVAYVNLLNGESVTPTISYRLRQEGYREEQILSLKEGFYSQVYSSETGTITDLGFLFRVADFTTEYYPPTYSYTAQDGTVITVSEENVQTDSTGKLVCCVLQDGVEKEYPVTQTMNVKHYQGTLAFSDDNIRVSKKTISVNHPVYHGDWKIYLMDAKPDTFYLSANPLVLYSLYGQTQAYGAEVITLMLKKDPTEFLSVAGILLMIIGTWVMCFFRPRDRKNKDTVRQEKTGKEARHI